MVDSIEGYDVNFKANSQSSNRKPRIAFFIDEDNLHIHLKENKVHFDIIKLCKCIQEYGRIVLGKCYCGANEKFNYPGWKLNKLYKLGVEIVPVPVYSKKSLADGVMYIDVLNCVRHYSNIDIWILASNDKDFLPLLKYLVCNVEKDVWLVHSQHVKVTNELCESFGIKRFLYQDLIDSQEEDNYGK